MVELGARLLIAGIVMFLSGVFGLWGFDFAWKTSLAISAIAVFGWRLELKNFKNPGVAGFIAIADAYTVGLLLANVDQLSNFGFLVLAPCAYAAAKYQSPPNFMAPLAASALLVSHSILHSGQVPPTLLLAQAGAVLALGLLLSQTKVVEVRNDVEEPADENSIVLEREDYFEMRENFRKLRDAYRDLEYKSRRGRTISLLEEAKSGSEEKIFNRLIAKVKEVTGADHAALYTVAQMADQFIVRAATADYPADYENASLRTDFDLAPGQIKHRMEQALLSVKTESVRSKVTNVILIESGRVTGMLTLGHTDPARLADAQAKADEIAPYLAGMIQEELRKETERRRLKETELLYEVATVTSGATNATTLAARVARELFESIEPDHVGIYLIEGNESILLANQGVNVRLLESMTFSTGAGLAGWVTSDAPEIVIFDAREDHRLDPQVALKKRVGSFLLIPLAGPDGVMGYVAAASHNRGGLDKPEIESLRVASVELAHALLRLEGGVGEPEGVMTPNEFSKRVAKAKGSLVYLEPLRREQIAESFGKSALAQALRRFVGKLKRDLPKGGCICRRDEGDYVVFLPATSLAKATSWANEATATAAMVAIKTADGSSKIPLSLRSKVAALDRQEHEVFNAISA
jgi:GAF domain-containing protein